MAPHAARRTCLPEGIRTLDDDVLIVVLSDTHIGGDPGSDIFESSEHLAALLTGLAAHDTPVELVLAGDFFDFLQIGNVPVGMNRAAMTTSRPEYADLFTALRRIAAVDGHRVICMPGNHDAELWWNPDIQRTLHDEGLVTEFALSYAVRYKAAPGRIIYCEHGNQFDLANVITDYGDPLDTPLGDHIVTDVTRRIAPAGRISPRFDLSDIGRVYPLVTVLDWIAGRVFYDLLARMTTRLLLPLVIGYAAYRIVAYGVAEIDGGSSSPSIWDRYRALAVGQTLFAEAAWDLLLLVSVFILFFFATRRAAQQMVSALTARIPGEPASAFGLGSPVGEIERLLESDDSPPMYRDLPGRVIDIFISGHTHAPALSNHPGRLRTGTVIVNSGCWLRQLRPVAAHFGGPPVFTSRFVQTHVRLFRAGDRIRVELWEHPKPAPGHPPLAERLAIAGRQPQQPDHAVAPRVIDSREISIVPVA